MVKRCFLCGSKMDESTGLCTNSECVRSKPLPTPKQETEKDSAEVNTKADE